MLAGLGLESPPPPYVVSLPGPPSRILFFNKGDPYYEFSNSSPHDVVYQGKRYPTSEHLFQALKFLDGHPDIAEHIRTCGTSPTLAYDEAHRFSTSVCPDWRQVNIEKMDIVLYHKFTRHPDLKALLLDTGNAELAQHSPRDNFWGTGSNDAGRNELGKALMRLRTKLREDPNANGPRFSAALDSEGEHAGLQAQFGGTGIDDMDCDGYEETVDTARFSTVFDSMTGLASPQDSPDWGEIGIDDTDRNQHGKTSTRSRKKLDSSANGPRFSTASASGIELGGPQTVSPQDSKLCEFCKVRPKFQNHRYCGRTCATEAAKPCAHCNSKPRFGIHPYCSRSCAIKAGAVV